MKRPQAAALAITAAVAALGAFAYVRAADEPSGYVGKGQVVVQTTIAGSDKLTVGGDIAMEELGSRLRIDLLSLGFPGTSATISSLVGTQLFPPGGFTVVYDRKNSSYTVWSNAKQRYYTNAAAAGPAPNLPPGPLSVAVVAGGDLFGAFSFARSLKDDSAFTLSVGLAGHQTVNGHPASGLNFQYALTTNAGDTVDLHVPICRRFGRPAGRDHGGRPQQVDSRKRTAHRLLIRRPANTARGGFRTSRRLRARRLPRRRHRENAAGTVRSLSDYRPRGQCRPICSSSRKEER
jgi:hypothetical protein